MEESICEKAVQILRNTRDGDDLDPLDLKLLEHAVNGFLNERGSQMFDALYENAVTGGTYTKPPFHGVENLTVDHEGYVYWKATPIEHYNRPYSKASMESATELGRCCRYLEHLGLPVTMGNAVWNWDKIRQEHPGYEHFEPHTAHPAAIQS